MSTPHSYSLLRPSSLHSGQHPLHRWGRHVRWGPGLVGQEFRKGSAGLFWLGALLWVLSNVLTC